MPKAFILAAGFGTRLKPITDKIPKALIEVQGEPLIHRHLKALAKAKVTEVGINVHYLGAQIMNDLGDGSKFGVNIKYFIEDDLKGTLGGLINASEFLNEPFWCLSADIFTDFNFKLPAEPSDSLVFLVPNPTYHPQGDFGISDGKLSTNAPRFTYSNIAYLQPAFLAEKQSLGRDLGRHLVHCAEKNSILARMLPAKWYNVGTPEELTLANQDIA